MRRGARDLMAAAIAVLAATAVGSIMALALGQAPAELWSLVLSRTWGDAYGFGQVLFRATPLVFTGLSFAVAWAAGLVNVGAEGQLLVGSFVTALAGVALGGAPVPVAVVGSLGAGMLAGAALGAAPGALKARFGAHEVITTIMLNFVVGGVVLWLGRKYFFEPETVHTAVVSARLPGLGLAGSAASLAVVVALAAAALSHLFLVRTRLGFEVGAVGLGPWAAETAGIRVGRMTVVAMTVAGGLAGLVGSGTVLGYKGYFEQGMGQGSGFMGVAVALLARGRPLAIVPGALVFATLAQGGLAAGTLVPKELVEVLQGVVILVAAVTGAYLRREEGAL